MTGRLCVLVLGPVAVIAGLYFFWPFIELLLNAVTRLIFGGLILLLAAAFLYQAYDAFRSGITGTQPKHRRK